MTFFKTLRTGSITTLALLTTVFSSTAFAGDTGNLDTQSPLKSYTYNGVHYTPAQQSDYTEIGVAYMVNDKYTGLLTASGARYDPQAFTASHKTLPLGSVVQVTNPDTKQSISVTIIDRGPFVNGGLVELSQVAANAIGAQNGTLKTVTVEAILQQNTPRPNSNAPITVRISGKIHMA